MADDRLRDLERRWRETSAAEDEAAYLRESLRQGDMREEVLRFSAYCEHEASRMVLGAKVLEKPAEIEPWFENLAYYGARAWPHLHQLFYRSLAAVVVAADALQLFEQVCPEDGRPRKALQLAINWLVEPSIRNMRLAFSEGFVNCGADVGALDSALALFKDGHELAERAANAAMAIGSASIMNGPGQEQEMKPFLEEAQLALGHGDDCWKTIFRPKICHIMISYALYGWRNFQSLLPAHPFEKNWK